jgi:hypothetical protein
MSRIYLASVVLLVGSVFDAATAADRIYDGQWRTTNRKLDGTMTCCVTELGDETWQGRFFGVWQGVPFDYTVKFIGPPDRLRGTAKIDGANYTWTGEMGTGEMGNGSNDFFKGKFGGDRYTGYFELKERNALTHEPYIHQARVPTGMLPR